MVDQTLGPVGQEIEKRLREALAPTRFALSNDSASHSGHMGDDASGESHFTVTVESAAFVGLNRLARQRLVNQAVGDLVRSGTVHALAIRASAPRE